MENRSLEIIINVYFDSRIILFAKNILFYFSLSKYDISFGTTAEFLLKLFKTYLCMDEEVKSIRIDSGLGYKLNAILLKNPEIPFNDFFSQTRVL